MKLSRCVIIYCTHLVGLQVTRRRWESGKDQEALAASVNTHHAKSTVIYRVFCQCRGQLTFTHSNQRKISADRDFHIRSPCPSGPLQRLCVCLSVCRCVFVCCSIKLTLGCSSWQRAQLVIRVKVHLCWEIVHVRTTTDESMHSRYNMEEWQALIKQI